MNNLPLIAPQPQPEADTTMWGTVTQLSPLRVKLDGESVALPFTPTNLTSDVFVLNDRVLVMLLTNSDPATRSRRVVILGRAQPASSPLIGEIRMFAGSTAPSGWAICDGAALSRTTEAALFAVISTTYGIGDGSTTFNIPNLKGRVPAGRDAGDGQFDTLGETGGEKNHTLTTSEMPVHNHDTTASSTGILSHAGGTTPNFNVTGGGGTYTFASAGTIANAGSGNAHNNLQPYIVLNYIIRLR